MVRPKDNILEAIFPKCLKNLGGMICCAFQQLTIVFCVYMRKGDHIMVGGNGDNIL